jgi:hypothetical protein
MTSGGRCSPHESSTLIWSGAPAAGEVRVSSEAEVWLTWSSSVGDSASVRVDRAERIVDSVYVGAGIVVVDGSGHPIWMNGTEIHD